MDEQSRNKAFLLAVELRKQGVLTEIDHMSRSIKAQFKYADKIGAKYVAVIGESELLEGAVNVKNMADGTSEKVAFENAVA
jgi:histidyl-tRNA synthetase